ncbi:disintegrin and metalloproteinase domain-containing protein 12-like [Stegostoma tigrinum]|uniref:disintegrin and metalloproteinase domain-containing protein 12-like n=1 Tax=Stegostoma tigrinum TaxID=3053191 RepID=UPI0028703996|nr:disintegrin and metalloproteinase domain-containing protein 12-like [Stegostoma tigrinum]
MDTELHHCYYEGSVRGFPGSQVSASICSGLSALIVFNHRTYVIERLEGDKLNRHLLYRPEDLTSVPSSCGVKDTSLEFILNLQHSQRVKRDVFKETRYLEIVFVADNALYQNLESDIESVKQRLVLIANAIDMYYRPFNLRIALIGLEVWTTDQIEVNKDSSETLSRFILWRQENLLPRIPNDNAQLLLGGIFTDDVNGLAMLAGICSLDKSGAVNLDSQPSFLAAAATVAHELGHNLGMTHDTEDRGCNCADEVAGCIMETAMGFTFPVMFSSCSKDDLEASLLRGFGVCLYNMPDLDKLVQGQECGNLYVEKGEECDCGSAEECSDPCCEPSICKLKPGAKCPTSGPCCKDCEFLSAGTLCRPKFGDCDLPEYCRGNASACPENVFLKDGNTCNNGKFYCNNGICHSTDRQCKEIWGEGARSAPEACYQTTNMGGTEFGNCGMDEHNNYIKCTAEHAICGKIQCTGGSPAPLRGGMVRIISTTIRFNQTEFVCRATFSTLPDSSSPDMVYHGTRCRANKVCYDYKCQDASLFRVQECDRACNNRGVCNSKGNCHCEANWAPPFCEVNGPGGSIDSGPTNDAVTAGPADTLATDISITPALEQSISEMTAGPPEMTEPNTGITPELGQSTGERTAGPPDTLATDISITPALEQSISEMTDSAIFPEITNELQYSTTVTPGATNSDTLAMAHVVPILTMSIMVYFIANFLRKKGIACWKSNATSTVQLSCQSRDGDRASTSSQDLQPTTTV